MTNIIEQEIAEDLRKLGLKSCWGGSDGVFLDSKDALRIVKLLKWLNHWIKPQTKRKSFSEVALALREIFGAYSSRLLDRDVKPLDLG